MADRAARAGGRRAKLIGGVIAGAILIAGTWIGARLFLWGLRRTGRAIRFGFAVATFRLYQRCPDCKGVIRGDARVCRHCGYRRSAEARPSQTRATIASR